MKKHLFSLVFLLLAIPLLSCSSGPDESPGLTYKVSPTVEVHFADLNLNPVKVNASVMETSDQIARKSIIEVAQSFLHVREKTGRNDGPEIDRMLSHFGFRNAPWCAAYVYSVYKQAGQPIVKTALAANMAPANRLFYKRTPNYKGLERAEQGDLYFFWSTSQKRINHVGIFTSQPNNTAWVHGIEGNTSVRDERNKQGVSLKVRTKAMVYSASDWISGKKLPA